MIESKNKTKIESLIGGLEGVFYPKINYPGTYYFPITLFYDSSLAKNGLNAAEVYFNNKYNSLILNVFNDVLPPISVKNLYIRSEIDEEGKRIISIDPGLYFIELANREFKCNLSYELFKNKEKLEQEYTEALKDLRRRTREIIKGIKRIEDDEQIYGIYTGSIEVYKKNLKNYKPNNNRKSLIPVFKEEKFLNDLASILTTSIHAFKYLNEDLSKYPLNLEEVSKCINYDAFYLMFANFCLKECKKKLKNNNEISYLVLFLNQYINVVNELQQKNGGYDIEVLFAGNNPKIVEHTFSYKKFLNDYIKVKHLLVNDTLDYYGMINSNDGNDYTIINNVLKEIERLKAKKEVEVLAANWDLIPKGELKKEPSIKIRETIANEKSISSTYKIDANETYEATLEYLDYEYKLNGKDKFIGYRGYMFRNGYILFERIKIDKNNKVYRIPGNATYLMTIDNFIKMSKLSKPELISYIKAGNTDVRRIYHNLSYNKEVLEVQNKEPYYNVSVYTDGIIGIIRNLIETGELIKDLPKDEEVSLKLEHKQQIKGFY
ncbi:MAG: hypothetical protein ACI31M_04655 [Bacilli bacterium]